MRFTIRDIIWLTTLVAVLLAWWVDKTEATRRREQERSQAQREVEMLKARIKILRSQPRYPPPQTVLLQQEESAE